MKKYLTAFLLFIPTIVVSQDDQEAVLASAIDGEWTNLQKNWKYKVGDNANWANADFDDTQWHSFIQNGMNLTDLPGDPMQSGIVWFRTRLKVESSLDQQLVMRIFQTGASEIYLDGKRIHKLGTVNKDPEHIQYYNPGFRVLPLTLESETEHVLAIRFCHMPSRFPLFSNDYKSRLTVRVAPLEYASADQYTRYMYRYYMATSVATFMFILFISLYLFFPSKKINLYFSLSSLSFTFFLIATLITISSHKNPFFSDFLSGIFSVIYILLSLFCFYHIFKRKYGILFWTAMVIGGISIPALFLFDIGLVLPVLGIFVLFESIRVSINSLNSDKLGALTFLIFGMVNIVFWSGIMLDRLSVVDLPILFYYQPFAFLLLPLSLAIYLGLSFGRTSQTLKKKLEEVKQLSKEKQMILAEQNERLEQKVKERTSALHQSMENLKSTQSQLIQSEKMASLGELTAGIAHEIQNPLNFVNNFAEVNSELVEELSEELEKGNLEEVKAITRDILENENKIKHHGQRAESIVKGMLQHSRTMEGEKEPTDINALADECLRLAYHGMRAKDKTFNADFKLELDPKLPKVNVVPQDIGRVLLNLINNAFYAVSSKAALSQSKGATEDSEYRPEVTVSTKILPLAPLPVRQAGSKGGQQRIQISVSDNGPGIPDEIKDKIFQPFFTTKPTGSGTGLGLSLSYDIVKAHGGEIKLKSEVGKGSEFVIHLPIV